MNGRVVEKERENETEGVTFSKRSEWNRIEMERNEMGHQMVTLEFLKKLFHDSHL